MSNLSSLSPSMKRSMFLDPRLLLLLLSSLPLHTCDIKRSGFPCYFTVRVMLREQGSPLMDYNSPLAVEFDFMFVSNIILRQFMIRVMHVQIIKMRKQQKTKGTPPKTQQGPPPSPAQANHQRKQEEPLSLDDQPRQIKESELTTVLMQTKTLLWRNFNIFIRKKKILMFMVFTPLMICLMLRYMTNIVDSLRNVGSGEQPIEPIGKVQKCTNPLFGDEQCATIGYSIIGDKGKNASGEYNFIHELMQTVAKQNDFQYGKDVKMLTVGKSSDFKEHLLKNMNLTSYAVLFCAENWSETMEIDSINRDMYNHSLTKEERDKLGKQSFDFYMPCKFDYHPERETIFYSVLYNMSLQENAFFKAFSEPFWKDNNLLALKNSLDNSVLEIKAKQAGMSEVPKIELSYQAYPYVPDRLYQGADPVVATGSFYVVLVPLTVFMIIFEENYIIFDSPINFCKYKYQF